MTHIEAYQHLLTLYPTAIYYHADTSIGMHRESNGTLKEAHVSYALVICFIKGSPNLTNSFTSTSWESAFAELDTNVQKYLQQISTQIAALQQLSQTST